MRLTLFLCLCSAQCLAQDLTNISELKTQATNGNVTAQTSLGYRYLEGKEVLQNFELAAYWFKLAAKNPDSQSAQSALAYMYRSGSGVAPNPELANKIALKLANEGHVSSQIEIGRVYYIEALQKELRPIIVAPAEPQNLQPNLVQACKWLTIAKSQDSSAEKYLSEVLNDMKPHAINLAQKLASEFKTSPRTPLEFPSSKSPPAAPTTKFQLVEWQLNQATNGNSYYQHEVSKRYLRGDGVSTNTELARYWNEKASAAGFKPAIELKPTFPKQD